MRGFVPTDGATDRTSDQKRRVASEPSLSSNQSTGGWGCTC
ncbi:hypothetical protein A2U01_0106996, partial [Trifolium medium]|nr:hypothetical protein [Trifolium medium]